AGPLWIKEKLFMDRQLREALGYDGEILYAEHHESHAASAFFPSPFEEAAILTMDGVGEWATASLGVGRGRDLELLRELHWPESKLTQREMDLARSIQVVCEEVMLRMARALHRETGMENLCLAGGVALNCVGNGRILREGPYRRVWIQPAAGDAGGALGVAEL